MAEKRPNEGSPEPDTTAGQLVAVKKLKTEGGQIVTRDGIKRTSSLLAPTMQLTGQVQGRGS